MEAGAGPWPKIQLPCWLSMYIVEFCRRLVVAIQQNCFYDPAVNMYRPIARNVT